MMLKKGSKAVLLKIYIGESDRYRGKPLFQYLIDFFSEKGLYGATATRGITGFGATSRIHTSSIIRLSSDLPVVIEVVDSEEKINEIKPFLEEIIGGGLVIQQEAEVCYYRSKEDSKK
ncbi:PII-like signaling protein [Methanomicrobium sp. W14]|uniref:DUF190 domain-containing protein n=1 Tax=Methanomicrobium sp. W14 TaxID=2817839 RepID=UPI001AE2B554|nr:DUF190 domain-containing protein [Methanomicrobium sp. W14]MBP2133460.1 PII-like signaling protein [Methanomicrobium sp. W14]